MPRQRDWYSLSDSYRQRLERSGITPEGYNRGDSLSAARGHASTPERPGTGLGKAEYQSYYDLRRDINQLKYDVYGSEPGQGSKDELKGKSRRTLEKARAYLEMLANDLYATWEEMEDDYPEIADEDWEWLRHYH